MPRLLRYPLADVPQHVIQRGHNRQPVFFHQDDYRMYLHCLHAAATVYACAIHAYVLMTNHVHLLLTPHRADSLAKVVQSLGRRYVQYINTTYQRTGTLWEGRYRASVVEADTYLLACSRYIELNPVRARMVPQPAAYPWSSYHWHALGHPDLVVTDHALYRRLGGTPQERQQAYQALFQGQLSAGLVQEIRTTLQQGRVLGTDRFKDAPRQGKRAGRAHPLTPRRPLPLLRRCVEEGHNGAACSRGDVGRDPRVRIPFGRSSRPRDYSRS